VLPDAVEAGRHGARVGQGNVPVRNTDALAIKAANLVRDDIDAAEKLAYKGHDDKASATACELIKYWNRQQAAATDPKVKEEYSQKIIDLMRSIAPKLTKAGQFTQAASILSRNTPEGLVRFAVRLVDDYNAAHPKNPLPDMTPAQVTKLLDDANAVEKMPSGTMQERVARARAFQRIIDSIASLAPVDWWTKLMTFIKAGLLTGPHTHTLNAVANLSMGITEEVSQVPAAGLRLGSCLS